MPKRFPRLKKDAAAGPRRTVPRTGKADSVANLLQRSGLTLDRIREQAKSQHDWHRWLQDHLPADLAARITGVVEAQGKLTVFAESSAWSTRLRFALAEIAAEVKAAGSESAKVEVRVLPRGANRR